MIIIQGLVYSESLTAVAQICHIRDVENDGRHRRFRRLLEESEPALESLDGYTLVEERQYADANPQTVFKEFRHARVETLKIINNLTPTQHQLSGTLEGYGRVTAKGLAHFLCSHDQQHLAGLQWLLGRIASIPPGAN